MSITKKLLAVAAVSALTAATAVPALALENEFHGMYRFKGVMSNIQNAAGGQAATISNDPFTRTYMEQRARLMYIAKANDDLKLVTHFELDYSKFGDLSYSGQGASSTGAAAGTRNTGGALGADEINLETKSIYLDFNLPTKVPVNFKVGMQPWIDSYGGLFVNADMAGILASAKYGDFSNSVGFFRFDDVQARPGFSTDAFKFSGKNVRDFFVVDSKYNVTKDLRVGASYYLINDDIGSSNATPTSVGSDPARLAQSSIFHTLGVNAQAKVGIATIDGGFLYQFGNLEHLIAAPTRSSHLSAFGGYVGSKLALGPGTFNIVAAYTSGDKNTGSGSNAFQSIGNTTSSAYSENTFYGANMHILMRSKYEINSGGYVIPASNNKNQGMIVGSVGYDMKFTDKIYGSANAGFGAVAKTNNTSITTGDSNYLGTELNAEVGYKLYDSLSASIVGAYLMLGDYYKGAGGAVAGKTPDNPFYSAVMLNYVF